MAIIQVNMCYKVEISKVNLLIAIKTAGVLATNEDMHMHFYQQSIESNPTFKRLLTSVKTAGKTVWFSNFCQHSLTFVSLLK